MKILFQGDSITDAGRDRSDPHHLGTGYAYYAAKMLEEKYPNISFEFLNQGVGGDKTPDLAARWETDCIAHQPDIMSIMIGINDAAFKVSDEDFERLLRDLLTQVREQTSAKILMVEAFLLVTPGREGLRSPLDSKLTIQRRVARDLVDEFVAIDGPLTGAALHDDLTTWAWDGVHPSDQAAQFIAGEYVKGISKMIDKMI